MAKNSLTGSTGRKHQWFARRQVYLRAGQDSQYVELSPLLQVGVALGFGALAFWLIGASYGAITHFLDKDRQTALLAELGETQQALAVMEQDRDAALEESAKIVDLETALEEAQTAATEVQVPTTNETLALNTELEQTRGQLGELQLRLSESKADHAALQAKFEAELLATSDAGEKTAEEASSLHAQLEEAYAETESLRNERDGAATDLATLREETSAREEVTERNTALLKAATAEIERLQENIASAEDDTKETDYDATIANLEEQLNEAAETRGGLERDVAELRAGLDEAKAAASETVQASQAEDAKANSERDAEYQSKLIAADLKEADLLATIEDLRVELAAVAADDIVAESSGTQDQANGEIQTWRQRATLAEAEIERLILKGLTEANQPIEATTPSSIEADEDPGENARLRSALLTAEADIIKLNADVKAAKQRLAERSETSNGQVSKPDNTAKLEQQLASTRSRVQQLNKALSDAKLREVAIDLALINVVPSPSPPAPR